jgi:hypothetical protein
MHDRNHDPDLESIHDPAGGCPPAGSDIVARLAWARRATAARAEAWAADRVIDPGDVHDKGELSLCVGEGC